ARTSVCSLCSSLCTYSYHLCLLSFFFLPLRPPPISTLFPYTTLFRSDRVSMQAKRMGCDSSGFFSLFNGRSAECAPVNNQIQQRSEEHTSELQSHLNLVCRLLLEKKKKKTRLQNQTKNHQKISNISTN